jgi:hypothetical protein
VSEPAAIKSETRVHVSPARSKVRVRDLVPVAACDAPASPASVRCVPIPQATEARVSDCELCGGVWSRCSPDCSPAPPDAHDGHWRAVAGRDAAVSAAYAATQIKEVMPTMR